MAEPTFGHKRVINRPRLRTLEPGVSERHASWLELFFDLVFVLAVAQLARMLGSQSDTAGVLKYIILFLPVWYAWVGFTYYADRFETEETAYRVLMFTGMLAVTGLSLTLGNAFRVDGDTAFIVCYVFVRLVLVALYARAAYFVPLARPYCLQFIGGLGASSALLLLSLLLDPPTRYVLWALTLALELATPFLNIKATRLIPIDRSHLPERFGLFTIIVLGEAVIAAATGVSTVGWNLTNVLSAVFGFSIAASIWWINFDFVEDDALRSKALLPRFVFLYGHFFIVASIVTAGVGMEHSIKESGTAHLHTSTLVLVSLGLASFLTSITIVRLVTGVCNLVYIRFLAIAASLMLMFGGQFMPPLAVISGFLPAHNDRLHLGRDTICRRAFGDGRGPAPRAV